MIVRCGTLVLPNELRREQSLRIANGRIIEIAAHMDAPEQARVMDATRQIVLPGFIDTHVHGAINLDTMDATPESLYGIAGYFARHGVTAFCPTTMTAPRSEIDAAVANIKHVMAQPRPDGTAQILGAHIEGPYLNPKRAGAQSREHMRPAAPDEYEPWFASGAVKLITVAPELHPQNMALIEAAQRAGVAVALGHTDATYAEALAAFGAGANQTTHTYNGMRPLHHREPGVLGAAMTQVDVFTQLICDGWHVHPAAMKALYLCKGADKLVAISDAVRVCGLSDGDYRFADQEIRVRAGQARLPSGELAGATVAMDVGFRTLLRVTDCGLVEAARMCATTPAASIGLGNCKGKIALGYDADLAFLSEDLQFERVMVRGN